MEIKFFIFDNNLDIHEFKKTFDIKTQIKSIPSFYNSKLYIADGHYYIYDSFVRKTDNITYGSLISFDCDAVTLKKIDTWYLSRGFLKRKIIKVTPIGFNSLDEFFSCSYKTFEKEKCIAYVLDSKAERTKLIRNNRHFKSYEFHKKFLINYKK